MSASDTADEAPAGGAFDRTFAFARERSTRVVAGDGARACLPEHVSALEPDGVVLVHDRRVDGFAREVADSLGVRTRLPIEGGELCKQLVSVGRLSQALLDAGATRGTVLVGMGGGTVTDLVGLLGAVHLRGLRTVLCPTTTLGMCDAALGGKNGVDHGGLKNVIGTIRQPELVVADTDWLTTLDDLFYGEGLAEVVKMAAVLDADGFAWLERCADALAARDGAALATCVALACRLKMDVVVDDPDERDRRRWLNFGHTLGHALESVAGLGTGALRHGRAVALGMVAECRAARDVTPPEVTERLRVLLARLGLETTVPPALADAEQLWARARRDKKAAHGRLPHIVPDAIGRGVVRMLERSDLERALGTHE